MQERRDAIRVLIGRIEKPETLETLLLASKDVEAKVREVAAQALGQALQQIRSDDPKGFKEKLLPIWEKPTIQVLRHLMDDQNREVQLIAAVELKELGEHRDLVDSILKATARDEKSPRRWGAIFTLTNASWDDPVACQAILQMTGSLNPKDRITAMGCLKYWSRDSEIPAEIFEILAKGMRSSDRDTRWAAVSTASYFGPAARSLVTPLTERLTDPSKTTCYHAAQALFLIGVDAEPALPAMRKLAGTSDNDPAMNFYGLIANLEMKIHTFHEQFLPQSRSNLLDPDPVIQSNAANLLGMAGPAAKELVPDLIRTLGSPDAKVRRASAIALGQIDPRQAEEALSRAAGSDPDETVRMAAKSALQRR